MKLITKFSNMAHLNLQFGKRKGLVLIAMSLLSTGLLFAQANPGGDPPGLPTPIDGGILMGLLAAGGLVSMLVKKKKEKE